MHTPWDTTAIPGGHLGMSKFALFRLCLTVLGIILVTPAALWWFDFKNRRTRRQESVSDAERGLEASRRQLLHADVF